MIHCYYKNIDLNCFKLLLLVAATKYYRNGGSSSFLSDIVSDNGWDFLSLASLEGIITCMIVLYLTAL